MQRREKFRSFFFRRQANSASFSASSATLAEPRLASAMPRLPPSMNIAIARKSRSGSDGANLNRASMSCAFPDK